MKVLLFISLFAFVVNEACLKFNSIRPEYKLKSFEVSFEDDVMSSENTVAPLKDNSTGICLNKKTTHCSSYQQFNDETCQCECRDGCNACYPPQVWNANYCFCECPEVLKCHKDYQYWDEHSCSCKCRESRRGCCDGKIWNKKICICECVNATECPPDKIFSRSDCKCVCKDFKICKLPFTWNEKTCSCTCPKTKCQENFVLNNSTCGCECNQAAQKNCTSRITTWNAKKCLCECKNPKIKCLNGTMVDPSTNCTTCMHRQRRGCQGMQKWFRKEGKCRCPETNRKCAVFSDNGMHIWDDINCKCKCNVTDDQIACSVDEYFDYASCRCICNVRTRECPFSLVWNPLTCKCTLESKLPSFDLPVSFNQTLPGVAGIRTKDEI